MFVVGYHRNFRVYFVAIVNDYGSSTVTADIEFSKLVISLSERSFTFPCRGDIVAFGVISVL